LVAHVRKRMHCVIGRRSECSCAVSGPSATRTTIISRYGNTGKDVGVYCQRLAINVSQRACRGSVVPHAEGHRIAEPSTRHPALRALRVALASAHTVGRTTQSPFRCHTLVTPSRRLIRSTVIEHPPIKYVTRDRRPHPVNIHPQSQTSGRRGAAKDGIEQISQVRDPRPSSPLHGRQTSTVRPPPRPGTRRTARGCPRRP